MILGPFVYQDMDGSQSAQLSRIQNLGRRLGSESDSKEGLLCRETLQSFAVSAALMRCSPVPIARTATYPLSTVVAP